MPEQAARPWLRFWQGRKQVKRLEKCPAKELHRFPSCCCVRVGGQGRRCVSPPVGHSSATVRRWQLLSIHRWDSVPGSIEVVVFLHVLLVLLLTVSLKKGTLVPASAALHMSSNVSLWSSW